MCYIESKMSYKETKILYNGKIYSTKLDIITFYLIS